MPFDRFTSKALHAVTSGSDGHCKVWSLSGSGSAGQASCVRSFSVGPGPVNKCLLVGDEAGDAVTCDEGNTRLTLWTSPVGGEPRRVQTVKVRVRRARGEDRHGASSLVGKLLSLLF